MGKGIWVDVNKPTYNTRLWSTIDKTNGCGVLHYEDSPNRKVIWGTAESATTADNSWVMFVVEGLEAGDVVEMTYNFTITSSSSNMDATVIGQDNQQSVSGIYAWSFKPKQAGNWTRTETATIASGSDKFFFGMYFGTLPYPATYLLEFTSIKVNGAPVLPYVSGSVAREVKQPFVSETTAPTANLPSGYAQLTYIESTGTQWIDTGVAQNQDTGVDITFEIVSYATNGDDILIFGSSEDGIVNAMLCGAKNHGWVYFQHGNTDFYSNPTNGWNKIGRIYNVVYDNVTSSVYCNDSLVNTFPNETFTARYPMILFGYHGTQGIFSNSSLRMYHCKIYNNGVAIRDYVPCKNASGVAGMYDTVNNVFYENGGTGSFIGGDVIAPYANEEVSLRNLPSGYTQLAHITSTGTQYIDTGFVPNQDTRTVMKVLINRMGEEEYLFGVRPVDPNVSSLYEFHRWSNAFSIGYNSGWVDLGSYSGSMPFTIDLNKNNLYFNGILVLSATYATFSCSYPMYLFNASGNHGFSGMYARLYDCQIYDNDILVRDYVPAMRDSDGKVGLYDLVNGVFYTNAGTGKFIAGKFTTIDSGIVREVIEGWVEVDNVWRWFFGNNYTLDFYRTSNGYGTTVAQYEGNTPHLKASGYAPSGYGVGAHCRIFENSTKQLTVIPAGSTIEFTVRASAYNRYSYVGLTQIINDNHSPLWEYATSGLSTVTKTITTTSDCYLYFCCQVEFNNSSSYSELWIDSLEINGEKIV